MKIEFEVTSCYECPFCEPTNYSGGCVDYICTKSKQKIIKNLITGKEELVPVYVDRNIEYRSEQRKDIPSWCPFKKMEDKV